VKKLVMMLLFIGAGYYGYQHFYANKSTALEPLYEMPYVVVYGQTSCSWTQKCLRELKDQQIDVIFENIDKPEVKQEIFPRVDAAGHKRNQIVIPIIDVNGHILVGYEPEKVLALYRGQAK
jgi:hypothetical protein